MKAMPTEGKTNSYNDDRKQRISLPKARFTEIKMRSAEGEI